MHNTSFFHHNANRENISSTPTFLELRVKQEAAKNLKIPALRLLTTREPPCNAPWTVRARII